mmetsp:Transcript_11163/g.20192  ORF Transcript_11163/g.20192 Transcript_11163/m.20192 type:complete len:206 (-) Transcript_11163:1091-1708(-)
MSQYISPSKLSHTRNFQEPFTWGKESSDIPSRSSTTYTVFHNDVGSEERMLASGHKYVPPYLKGTIQHVTARARDDLHQVGFKAVSQKFTDEEGVVTYRFGHLAPQSTIPPPYSTFSGEIYKNGVKNSSGGLVLSGSRGISSPLPPTQFKAWTTENKDEYRAPVDALNTLSSLTLKYNTTGGVPKTQTSLRSNGMPGYPSNVTAF